MTVQRHKSGQVAIFLVLILAGLALLLALNVDVFTSSRSKIRLQNAADASALALARWQGATLNMIGDLNLARLAAVCQSNENAVAGIGQLQSRLAFIGPTIGFKAANDIAEKNGVRISADMTLGTRLMSEFMEAGYKRMLDVVLRNGIRAGVDNASILRAGNVDPRTDPDFYEAIRAGTSERYAAAMPAARTGFRAFRPAPLIRRRYCFPGATPVSEAWESDGNPE
jgi:hypothetical protein